MASDRPTLGQQEARAPSEEAEGQIGRVGGRLPWSSSVATRRSMQSNRSKDTALEIGVRSALHRTGLRFRKHVQPIHGLRCTPDIVFPGVRLALFIDGCWWHACPEHASYPQTNAAWWQTKLEANVVRDRRNDEALMSAGWHVMHVWEHQPVDEIVTLVRERLATLRQQ